MSSDREPGPDTQDRDRYLREFVIGIDSFLSQSIHHARFIDLGIADWPQAIRTPLLYEAPPRQDTLENLPQAFQAAGGRLLVLGAPGSGKTTSLLMLARSLAEAAREAPEAPVPLLVNLSLFPIERLKRAERGAGDEPGKRSWGGRFGLRSSNDGADSITGWLRGQLADRAQISLTDAESLLRANRVAILLDGLDEVNDERRVEFARLLNDTLLREHPDIPIVVCSRVNEYLPVQEDESARLQLHGAALLLPLAGDAIREYVEAARVPTLRQALDEDPELLRLSETPLMLSLMTLAYAGATREQIPSQGSLAERRHFLMERYVDRMLQRAERRRRGLPTDVDAEEIPVDQYRYSPETVQRCLSWIALRMSLRMRTSFKPAGIFQFLTDTYLKRAPREQLTTSLPMGLLCGLLGALAVLPYLPHDAGGKVLTLLIAFGLPFIVQICAVGQSTTVWAYRFVDPLGLVSTILLIFLSLGAVSRAISAVVPAIQEPLTSGMIFVTATVALMADDQKGRADRDARFAPMLAGFLLSWLVLLVFWRNSSFVTILSELMASFGATRGVHTDTVLLISLSVLLFVAVWFWNLEESHTANAVVSAILVIAALLVLLLSLKLAFLLAGVTAALLIGSALSGIGLSDRQRWNNSSDLLITTVIAFLGGLIFGQNGTLVLLLVSFLSIGAIAAFSSPIKPKPASRRRRSAVLYKRFVHRTNEICEQRFLSPCTWWMLSALYGWPLRSGGFLGYCRASLLLKPLPEIEFIHRRLRDYFALLHLLPELRAGQKTRTLQAIEALRHQGEAAIETLADYVREGDIELACAAVLALGWISAPEATAEIERASIHPDPAVRRSALFSLWNKPQEVAEPILDRAISDSDPSVQRALIAASRPCIVPYDTLLCRLLTEHPHREDLLLELLAQPLGLFVDNGALIQSLGGVRHREISGLPNWVYEDCVLLLEEQRVDVAPQALSLLATEKWSVDSDVLIPYLDRRQSLETQRAAVRALIHCTSDAAPILLRMLIDDSSPLQEPVEDALRRQRWSWLERAKTDPDWQRIQQILNVKDALREYSRLSWYQRRVQRRQYIELMQRLEDLRENL